MRTIKFRAWITEAKQMIEHNAIDFNDFLHKTNLDGSINHSYCGDDDILMQFTGLYDKNGKEIYEGDILNVGENLVCEIVYVDKNVEDYGDEIHCAFHAKVYIHNKTIPLDSYLKNNCEIIGNIHENPELLNN